MKGSELKKLCEQYEDFDFEFCFTDEPVDGSKYPNFRFFNKLELADVGHSDKRVLLSGEEKK